MRHAICAALALLLPLRVWAQAPCAPSETAAMVDITSGADDAMISGGGTDSAALTCRTVTTNYNDQATRLFWPPWYAVSVGVLKFHTADALPPGAVLTSAWYRYWAQGARDDDKVGQRFEVHWYDPPAEWSCADWSVKPAGPLAGSKPLTTYQCGDGYSCDASTPIDIPLVGLENIHFDRDTGMRLYISERDDGKLPQGLEYVYPMSWEDGSATDRQSCLVLCYQPSACP